MNHYFVPQTKKVPKQKKVPKTKKSAQTKKVPKIKKSAQNKKSAQTHFCSSVSVTVLGKMSISVKKYSKLCVVRIYFCQVLNSF
jgi:hypothetical protein